MSVCKFFLENRCRYGESCRFEHPRGGAQRNLFGSGGGGGTSWKSNSSQKVTFRDSFGATSGNQVGNNQFKWVANQNQGAQTTTQPTSALDLVNALPKEMEMWEKTKMWPFSCLSVEKDAPSLPDFVDTSVEELRLEYYEAQKTGNIAAYTQRLQNLVMEFQNKRMQLKHMNMDVKQKLVTFIEQARKNKANQNASSMSSSNPFAQAGAGSSSQATGIFGQASGGNLFGKSSGSTFGSPSVATTQTSLFGKPQGSSSLFSSSQTSEGQGSIFGGSKTSGSVFGGQSMSTDQIQSSGGLFGNSQSSQQMPGLFGGSSTPSQTGLFGKPAATASSNPFGNMASTTSGMSSGLFSNSPGPTPGLFAQSPSAGLFGTPANPSQPQNGLFGSSLSAASPGGGLLPTPSSSVGAGLFGKGTTPSSGLLPTPSPGLFGKGPSFNNNTPGSGLFGQGLSSDGSSGTGLFGKGLSSDNSPVTGLFGKGPSTSGPMTAPDADVNKGRHSKMEDLTEQDIEAFKASSFTLGKLPIKPPPKELIMI